MTTVLVGQAELAVNPTAVADAINSADQKVVLIEDASAADHYELRMALERVSHAPSGRRVILLVREAAELELARLYADGKIDLLDASALRLGRRDIAESLRSISQAGLRARIGRLAGHWPLAMDLMCAWAASTKDYHENWSDFDIVRESRVAEYLQQEIRPLFSNAEITALCRASLFDESDLDLLTTLVEWRGDKRFLADLAYRFKGLIDRHENKIILQDALRVWLREDVQVIDEDARNAVLLAMADKCSEQGRLAEAADLARRAGEPGRIRGYAHAHGALRIWIVHGFSVLKCLLENSTHEEVSSSVVLRMIQCIVHLKVGHIRVAQELFEGLTAEVGPEHALARDLEIVRVTLLTYGCALERTDDLELLRSLIADEAEDSAMRTFLATLSAVLNCQRARFNTAVSSLIDARSHAKRAQSHYNLMFLLMHETSINLAQGRLKNAKSCLAEARKRWKRDFPTDIGVETVIAALSASIEFEAGQLTSARSSLRKSAHRMPEAEAWFDIYFAAYETMIRINVIDHGIGPMVEAVESEAHLLRLQGLPRVADLIKAICLCVCGETRIQGLQVTLPTEWSIPSISATSSWQEHEVFTIARAYSLYFDGQHASALDLLDDGIALSASRGLERSRLRYLLVAYVMAVSMGDLQSGASKLRAAVAIGVESGMRRIFREIAGTKLVSGLRLLQVEPGLSDLEVSFVDMLLNGLKDSQNVVSGKLSSRELEVLQA
ncbi:MAG: hypothetical protein J0M19_01875, partial [Sphingomonadales bacterium]|nr:hypothetical protein [Sphingomonadales bacterium]